MNLTSQLESVSLYRDGAVCSRKLVIAPRAERVVQVGGLPMALVAGSLRARVVQGEGVVIDTRATFDVTLADEVDVPAEVKAVEESEALLRRLDGELQRLEREIDELKQLRPQFLEPKKGAPPRDAPVESMLQLGAFTDAALKPRLDRKRALTQERAEAYATYELRRRRVDEASSAKRTERSKVSRAAVITLREAPTTELHVVLEYQVPGTRWLPSYELRMAVGASKGALKMRALIAQATGEDWVGVRLSLSTAELRRRVELPELKALKIGRSQPPAPRSGFRAPPAGLDELFESFDRSRRVERAMTPTAMPVVSAVLMDESARVPVNRPAPMPKSEMAPDFAKKRAGGAPRASAPGAAPPPPPSAPAPRKPMADSLMMAAAPMMARGRVAKERDDRYDEDRVPESALEEESLASFGGGGFPADDESGSGLPIARMPSTPSWAPEADLLDYDRLEMPSATTGGGRGRLQPTQPWAHVFAVGVSVQIDIVMAMVALAEQSARQVSSLPLPANCANVVSLDSFDYRFDAQVPVDVPSKNEWTTVPVMTTELGLVAEYVCAPSVESQVYRTLQLTNSTPHALLPGPVDVTVGTEFLMTTPLPATPPGSSNTRLGLGVEEAIKIARKTQFREAAGGLLGGSSVLQHDVEIEISNRLPVAVRVDVRERVPIAEANEKDVKVEETQVQPAWEKIDGLFEGRLTPGLRRWKVSVPAAQKAFLEAHYSVRIPSDRMLVGGNRRS